MHGMEMFGDLGALLTLATFLLGAAEVRGLLGDALGYSELRVPVEPRLFVDRERWLEDAQRDAVLTEPDATTGRFGGEEVCVTAGQDPGDDPRAGTPKGLRDAPLDPEEVNHVSDYLRALVSGELAPSPQPGPTGRSALATRWPTCYSRGREA